MSKIKDTYRTLLATHRCWPSAFKEAMNESGMFPPGTELPLKLADIPPTEVIVQPLFPNVIIGTSNDKGFQWYSRSSMPSVPLLSGAGGV